jgi:acetylornithine deacetylase/succinyl-diaminopimelate desuccinylase-like protein
MPRAPSSTPARSPPSVPRYLGSENHKKLERYIASHLQGDQVEDDVFTADTVEGKFPVHNIIAKFPGEKDGIIVIMGHYDTNYPLRNIGIRRRQRRRVFHRHPARIRQPVARQ